MNKLSYWTTMAQISATFTGLIFVGLVFYLNNINEAIKDVKSKFHVTEMSSKLLPNFVLSNLILYSLPLAISLTLILGEEHSQFQIYFRLILVAINTCALIVTIWLYFSSNTKKYLRLDGKNKNLLNVKNRIVFGTIILIIIISGIYVLVFIFWRAENIESAIIMKLVAGFSLAAALLFSLSDLILFSTHHIFFTKSKELFIKIETVEKQIIGIGNRIDNKVSECCQKMQSLQESDPGEVKEYIKNEWPKINLR